MRVFIAILFVAFSVQHAFAQAPVKKQNVKPELRKGNELYKQKKYKDAQTAYLKALQKDPTSHTGLFNLGDALYEGKQYDQARQAMDASTKVTKDKKAQASAFHNIGNTYLQEKKWEDAINAYKQALRLNPADADTKYNLAYANAMLKKDGGGGGKDNKDNKNNKDNKDQNKQNQDKKDQDKKDQNKQNQDQKKDQDKQDQNKDQNDKGDQDKKEEQRPQGQPSKLSKQQAENLLNALRQEEKKLQDKKEKDKGVPVKLDKDW